MTPQAILSWTAPAWNDFLFFAGLGLFSAISHVLSTIAFRYANASTLGPLVYLELIGAVLIGYLAFRELPDTPTLIGAILIVVAGLLLLPRHQGRTRCPEPRQ